MAIGGKTGDAVKRETGGHQGKENCYWMNAIEQNVQNYE
jgi:hypothetical protein